MCLGSFGGVALGALTLGTRGAIDVALILLSAHVWSDIRGSYIERDFQALCRALAVRPSDAALRAIEAELAYRRGTMVWRMDGRCAWVEWTLFAATEAHAAGFTDHAHRWTATLAPRRVLRCSERALAALDHHPRHTPVRMVWLAARAHALAALGARREARALLVALRREHYGRVLLERIASQCGPASVEADSVRMGDGPYR